MNRVDDDSTYFTYIIGSECHSSTKMAEQEQLHSSLRSEKEHTSSLEKELTQTDKVANDLQVELTSTQQELQEALDFCSQHEALIDERNTELNVLETKIR